MHAALQKQTWRIVRFVLNRPTKRYKNHRDRTSSFCTSVVYATVNFWVILRFAAARHNLLIDSSDVTAHDRCVLGGLCMHPCIDCKFGALYVCRPSERHGNRTNKWNDSLASSWICAHDGVKIIAIARIVFMLSSCYNSVHRWSQRLAAANLPLHAHRVS